MNSNKMNNYKGSEKWLEKELVRRVKGAGGLALKFSSTTETGYPDRILILPGGMTCWAEIKSLGEKPRKIQQIRIDQLRRLGHTVYVVDREEIIDEIVNNINRI